MNSVQVITELDEINTCVEAFFFPIAESAMELLQNKGARNITLMPKLIKVFEREKLD